MLVGAKKIGRPVYWMSGRNESFVSDNHARDAYSDVELALDDKGKFLALRIRHLGSMGAYIGAVGANIQTANMMRCLPGMYDIKLIDAQTKCVFTNTDADRALSRRRPPGGELLPRARGRRGRARHRHRPDPAAAEEPDLEEGDAVQDRDRHHLRQRRLRHRGRQGPGARRLRGLQGAQEGSRRSAACCAASASASCWSTPAARRSKARRCRSPAATS